MQAPITIDFETKAIGARPLQFPPEPVGVAVDMNDGTPPFYAAWGHPTGNNSTRDKARKALANIWDRPLVFHNGGSFDIQVACEQLDLPWPREWHDTLYLLYLLEPHARSLALKPSAERLLSIPPTERDAVKDWVMRHVPGATAAKWGAHIALAPGELVGHYAAMDVTMTRKLWEYAHPLMVQAGMQEAYNRERELAPVLWDAERRGVRVDRELLESDADFYGHMLTHVDDMIRQQLGTPNLNIDSDDELANALERAGVVDKWVLTPTGRRSTSKKNMEVALGGSSLQHLLRYRGALSTCHGTFMLPWLELSQHDGRIHPTWNQTRNPDGKGTRTGRLSCSNPNLMNVPKEYEDAVPPDLPPLPLMRRYLLPEPGHVWARRDYSQQELRILAHYEDGDMLARYAANPKIDFHELAGQLIHESTGNKLTRKHVKTTAFSILYGAGSQSMAEKLGCTKEEAQALKDAYYDAVPGIRDLQQTLKWRARNNKPMKTWGGREYYCEPPVTDKKTGVVRSFEYKMLNYLIQGSAADCTKQGLLNYNATAKYGVFTVQVHDEINISVPEECLKQEMRILADAMADVNFDVPMLSDGSFGPNYQELVNCD